MVNNFEIIIMLFRINYLKTFQSLIIYIITDYFPHKGEEL